jgi:hypothetical protein
LLCSLISKVEDGWRLDRYSLINIINKIITP